MPNYPQSAKTDHVQGSVVVHVFIDENGTITNIIPLAGPDLLLQPTIAAVKQWKYAPYTCEGQPTRVESTVQTNFTMSF
jgi:TonB family protein